MLRGTLLALALSFATTPIGVGRAHVSKSHVVVGVATTAGVPDPGYHLSFAIAASDGAPFLGLAILNGEPIRIDCLSLTNVGVTGHKVYLNGEGDTGASYYVVIDDEANLDRVAVFQDPGTGPCRANSSFGDYLAGPIVVAG
jgi:hypothetical protein